MEDLKFTAYNTQFRRYSNKLSALLDLFCPLHNFTGIAGTSRTTPLPSQLLPTDITVQFSVSQKIARRRNTIISSQPFILLLVDFNPIVYCNCMPMANLCK